MCILVRGTKSSSTSGFCLYLVSVVTRYKCYTGACVGLPNPTIWLRNLSSLKLHKVQESAGSAVGDISIRQGDQAAIQGVTEQTKMYNL